jgi:hypothetical protein
MNDEDWETIEGYETYEVSDCGNVRKSKTGYNLTKNEDRFGNCMVTLVLNGERFKKCVHILVANIFIDNPYDYIRIEHIDKDRFNNHFSNLKWSPLKTYQYN